ncbi:MAG: conjugal transfer protein [Lachnospiraceae bacterium]|nr:conjugal transfer protein [Lachnospiraceae bacterium]
MEEEKLLRYTMQVSMLKKLLRLKLITKDEYDEIEKSLMKDYGVTSDALI